MDEVIFIEILGRAGEVVHRHQVGSLPATIGRGYDNDVILDDPYVGPQHLRLERTDSGELRLVDLGSRNGLHALDPARRVAQAPAQPEARFRIGHTQLRVRPRSYAVPAEREDLVRNRWQRKPAALAAFAAAAIACILWYVHTSSYERIEPLKLALPAVWLTLAVCAWASLWAFAGKAISARANFVAHANVAWAVLILAFGVFTVGGYAAFALSSSAVDQGTTFVFAAVVAWALFEHLTLVSRQRRRTLALAACGIVVALFGVGLLAEHAGEKERTSQMAFLREIKSPAFRLVPGESPEAFFAGAEKLKAKVDALRRED